MATRRPAEVFPPGDYLRDELDARGWTQLDLAEILDRPPRVVNEIVSGKRGISPETAKGLAAALDTSPELWLNLQTAYDLYRLGDDADHDPVVRRARLYAKAPIKDMLRRGWLERSNNLDVLEQGVLQFFGIKTLDEEPALAVAAHKTNPDTEHSRPQMAWFFRARQLSHAVHAAPYSPTNLKPLLERLRVLEREPREVREIPRALSEAGVKLVVVEHLPGTKIDGACFWVNQQPVVALSVRYDRIDNLWWVLLHELGHVARRHKYSIDLDLESAAKQASRSSDEIEADAFASEHIVPQEQLADFIARVYSVYSADRIEGFSRVAGVHPGIVVGQLQHREELHYSSFRKMLVPIRETLTAAALTDGWGHTVSLGKGN